MILLKKKYRKGSNNLATISTVVLNNNGGHLAIVMLVYIRCTHLRTSVIEGNEITLFQ